MSTSATPEVLPMKGPPKIPAASTNRVSSLSCCGSQVWLAGLHRRDRRVQPSAGHGHTMRPFFGRWANRFGPCAGIAFSQGPAIATKDEQISRSWVTAPSSLRPLQRSIRPTEARPAFYRQAGPAAKPPRVAASPQNRTEPQLVQTRRHFPQWHLASARAR